MTKRITMLSPIQGGAAYGPLTIAGSPYTVDDALAAEMVNRGVAIYTDPQVPSSVYGTFITYLTSAQFALLLVGTPGVTYELTDTAGRPQYRWNGAAFVASGSGSGGGQITVVALTTHTLVAGDLNTLQQQQGTGAATLSIAATAVSGIPWKNGNGFALGSVNSGAVALAALAGVTIVNIGTKAVVTNDTPVVVQMGLTVDTWLVL